jgi:hypothetical protein
MMREAKLILVLAGLLWAAGCDGLNFSNSSEAPSPKTGHALRCVDLGSLFAQPTITIAARDKDLDLHQIEIEQMAATDHKGNLLPLGLSMGDGPSGEWLQFTIQPGKTDGPVAFVARLRYQNNTYKLNATFLPKGIGWRRKTLSFQP